MTNYESNYLNLKDFEMFLHWLIRLETFVNQEHRYPMNADHFVVMFRIMYGCGLRVSEALNLEKRDFDLEHRILKIRKIKNGKSTIQKTTILPADIPTLLKFMTPKKENEKLFPTTKTTVWKYAKNAGRLAGLNIFEAQENREIKGIWTNLFRKSCAKRMLELGATIQLVQRKLRQLPKQAIDVYVQDDINTLLAWEKRSYEIQKLGSPYIKSELKQDMGHFGANFGGNFDIGKVKELLETKDKTTEILEIVKGLAEQIKSQHYTMRKLVAIVSKMYQDGELNKDTFNKLDEFLKPYYDNHYSGDY